MLVVEKVAMPAHELPSIVQVPLPALALKLPAPPTETVTAELSTVTRPLAPPTVIVSVAETFLIVITTAQTPLPFGVTV